MLPTASSASSASLAATVTGCCEGEAGAGRVVLGLLEPIPRSKYPALSEAEEAVSLPLQVR